MAGGRADAPLVGRVAGEGFPGSLVVLVRADRVLQLRCGVGQWVGADGAVRAVARSGRVRRPVRAAAWGDDVAGVGLDAGDQLRDACGVAGAAGSPLGVAADGGGDHAAPFAAVLHRWFPPAAAAELGGRVHAVPRDAGRGPHRYVAPGRHAVGIESRGHRRRGEVDPVHRYGVVVADVRRSVPRRRDRALLPAARVRAARRHDRALHRPRGPRAQAPTRSSRARDGRTPTSSAARRPWPR